MDDKPLPVLTSNSPQFLTGPVAMQVREPLSELKCRIETTFESVENLRAIWDEAVIRLGGTIYMSFDWARIWWEFYGGGKELRIFLFTAGEEVVGIVPLYIDCLGRWPIRFRVARLVGANIPPKVFDPPMNESWAEEMFGSVLAQLFEKDGCDLLSFGPVSVLHQATEQLPQACAAKAQFVVAPEIVTDGVHSIFWLPKSMEQYFEGLSKNERKNRRKYELRLLNKECPAKVEVVSDPGAVEKQFEEFVAQHTLHWREQGKPGHFGSWPKATEFNRALVKAHGRLGRMRFIRILAGDKVVSNQYTFAFGKSYVWELPARAVGQEWERFSLGPTGIVTMIGVAIGEGKSRLEGGLAHYEYKLRLGAKEHSVRRVRVVANRFGSRMRVLLFSTLRLCLLYGYHKIWYRRITPHLPAAFRKPQWNLWLRFDF